MLLQPGLLRQKIGSVPLPTSVLWYTLFCLWCLLQFAALQQAYTPALQPAYTPALQPACRAHWAMICFQCYPQITASRRFALGSSISGRPLQAVWRGFGTCTNTPASNSTRSGPLGGVFIQLEQGADVPHPKLTCLIQTGEPFMYVATVLIVQSTLVSWSPWLPLSLLAWLRIQRICTISIERPFDLRNEGVVQMISVFVLPPATHYIQLYTIITHFFPLQSLLPVKDRLLCSKSNLLTQNISRISSIIGKILAEIFLCSLKQLAAKHDTLQIRKCLQPQVLDLWSIRIVIRFQT